MPGMMLPVRSRTKPKTSNSGTIDSIMANTASYSATSTTCPAPPLTSLWRSAISAQSRPTARQSNRRWKCRYAPAAGPQSR